MMLAAPDGPEYHHCTARRGGLHWRGDRGLRAGFDGRARSLDGQRLHRTPLALSEIRGRLSERLADGREAKAGIGEYFAFRAAFIRRSAIARRWPSGAKARRKHPMDMWTTQTR